MTGLPIIRPITRGDCVDGVRPCPWVSCAHHLLLDVNPKTGSIKFNATEPDLSGMTQLLSDEDVERALCSLKQTCALDVADEGGVDGPTVAALMGVSKQAVQVMEERFTRRAREERKWRALRRETEG